MINGKATGEPHGSAGAGKGMGGKAFEGGCLRPSSSPVGRCFQMTVPSIWMALSRLQLLWHGNSTLQGWEIFTSLRCCFTLTSCILAPGSWYLFPSVHLVNELTEFAALSGFLQEKHSVKSQSLFL